MKNKKTTALLALFLGGLGVHRFYLGEILKGLISILFTWTIIPWIIGIVDFFKFNSMSNEFFDVKFNKKLNIHCSTCETLLSQENISFWNLGEGNPVCKLCFNKFRQKSRETGKYEFDDNEIKQIVNSEIKNRPLPQTNLLSINIPNEDFIEETDLPEDIEILKLNSLALISYEDAKGQKSIRRVTIKNIYENHNDEYMISAFCHERNAYRTFKLSRILELTDIETGEIFNNPKEYFVERFENSPIGNVVQAFQKLEDEILILAFMARADGFLRQKERQIISNYIKNKIDGNFDNEILDNEIRKIYCESNDFKKSIKKLKNNSSFDKNTLFNSLTDIVNSDKKTDPIEIGILEHIRQEFKL